MKSNTVKKHLFGYALFLAILFIFTSVSFAQKSDKQSKVKEFCSENWSNDDKVSFTEAREMTIRPTSLVTVDSGRNGGIKIIGENRSDILVRACVRTWGKTEEAAKSLAGSIRIATDSVIRAEGISEDSNSSSVSFEIHVPRSTNLKLETFNGGIGISGVEGDIDFKATNGGVALKDVGGDVKGKTTNGGISVTLAGNTWRGNGLDVETTNGGVHLTMPENFSAHFETRTVNGGFKSDIAALSYERDENDRRRGVNISKDINGGGALVRVVTTNGGVKISSASKN